VGGYVEYILGACGHQGYEFSGRRGERVSSLLESQRSKYSRVDAIAAPVKVLQPSLERRLNRLKLLLDEL
jgi:hypothetical protein